MTNTLALILGLVLIGALVADTMLTDGQTLLFLAKKFTDMTDWMAFRR